MTATSVAFFRNLNVGQRRGPSRDPGRGDVTVLAADHLHAIVLNHVERRSNGTPVIEWRLGVRATSRSVGTVQRLLTRLDRPERSPLPPRS